MTIWNLADLLDVVHEHGRTYGGPSRFWLGNRLLVYTNEVSHFEIVLNNADSMDKGESYDFIAEGIGYGLVTLKGCVRNLRTFLHVTANLVKIELVWHLQRKVGVSIENIWIRPSQRTLSTHFIPSSTKIWKCSPTNWRCMRAKGHSTLSMIFDRVRWIWFVVNT